MILFYNQLGKTVSVLFSKESILTIIIFPDD